MSSFEWFSVAAISVGLVIGVFELRQARRRRERESALRVFATFSTPEFVEALHRVVGMPDSLSAADIAAHPQLNSAVILFTSIIEALGNLVYKGELRIEIVEDNWTGPILIGWEKLRPYAEERRAALHQPRWMEWVQWLAERIEERQDTEPVSPAYLKYRDWEAT